MPAPSAAIVLPAAAPPRSMARMGLRAASLGGTLVALVALPPLGAMLEAGMATHMLLQYPALLLAGALAACGLPRRWREVLDAWNGLGVSGLLFVTLALAVLMIPRVLDLALTDGRVEFLKIASLLGCGLALVTSWRRAGLVVQGFFLGNVLPMTAVAGLLYLDAPLRVCNAYRLDEQQQVGAALVAIAATVAVGWLVSTGWTLVRQE
jgi:hypothetical protein